VLLFRRRRRGSAAQATRLPRRPRPGLLRRERHALLRVRAQRVTDLGGLAAEMYRYGAWRDDLIRERCAEIAGIDTRLEDIDALLRGGRRTPRCSCGAPLAPEASVCPHCGTPVRGAARELGGGDTAIVPAGRRD
jgi:hypothetical protein